MDNEDFVLGGYVSKRLFRIGVGIFILWWFGELGRVNTSKYIWRLFWYWYS